MRGLFRVESGRRPITLDLRVLVLLLDELDAVLRVALGCCHATGSLLECEGRRSGSRNRGRRLGSAAGRGKSERGGSGERKRGKKRRSAMAMVGRVRHVHTLVIPPWYVFSSLGARTIVQNSTVHGLPTFTTPSRAWGGRVRRGRGKTAGLLSSRVIPRR
jgi:hypothetical protein